MMYKPLRFFSIIGGVVFGVGLILGLRFLIYLFMGNSAGHVQSLILASTINDFRFSDHYFRSSGRSDRFKQETSWKIPRRGVGAD